MKRMQTPAEFWPNEIGENATSDVIKTTPYTRQTMVDSNQNNLFNKIALWICKAHAKEFLKGWIDLDYWWQHSQDAQIKRHREHEALAKIETPFCGRRVYQVRILVDKAKDANKDRTGKLMFGDLKTTSQGYYLTGQINVFRNEELGWQKKVKKQKVIDGVQTDVEEENTSTEFFYKWMSFFPTTVCGERMEEEIRPYIAPDVVVYAYFMGRISTQEYKGKTKHSLNVDDYIWMREE